MPIPFPFLLQRRIDFHQTDAAGLMHFSTYFFLMEAGEAAVFRELGIRLFDTGSQAMIGFPRVDTQCRFRRPLHFDDLVTIETALDAPHANRLFWRFRFFNQAGELTARGSMTTACVQRQPDQSLLSIPLPDQISAALNSWIIPSQADHGAH